MDRGHVDAPEGLLRIEDCLDADGNVVLPAGVTLISLIDRNIANVGDTIAYRYLDYSRSAEPVVFELTWTQLGVRLHAIAAHIQRSAERGDRVAILAPQGWTTSPVSSPRSRRAPSLCRCSLQIARPRRTSRHRSR